MFTAVNNNFLPDIQEWLFSKNVSSPKFVINGYDVWTENKEAEYKYHNYTKPGNKSSNKLNSLSFF